MATYASIHFNDCEIFDNQAISKESFVLDLFFCQHFCYFAIAFTLEMHARLDNSLLISTQAEVFAMVSIVTFTNNTLISQQQ